ncbi:putative Polysaccharide deacetylase family protein [Gammaproteobacteria bacterium]
MISVIQKQKLLSHLRTIGFFRGIRWWSDCRGGILIMHRVRKKIPKGWVADPGLWTTIDVLNQAIDLFQSEGYEIIPLEQGLSRVAANKQPFLCLTFDDGYLDNYEILFPWAQTRNIPIAIYLTTGFLDRDRPAWWCGVETLARSCKNSAEKYQTICQLLRTLSPTKQTSFLGNLEKEYRLDFLTQTEGHYMTWEMARTMAASGLVTLGVHTHSHFAASALTSKELEEELRKSDLRFYEEIGYKPSHFAFPYGDPSSVHSEALEQVSNWGYKSAALSNSALFSKKDPRAFPRLGLCDDRPIHNVLARLSIDC